MLQGGKFKSGFASGFFGHAAGGLTQAVAGAMRWGGQTAVIARTMMAATIGGAVSELTGGKFANGAVSAAFTHLFNFERYKTEEEVILEAEIRELEDGLIAAHPIEDGNGLLYTLYRADDGNLERHIISGGVESVAPELYVAGGVAFATSKVGANLAVRTGNLLLENPYRATVAVEQTVEFVAGRYGIAQGLLMSPGNLLGTASSFAFPPENYEGNPF